MQKQKEQTLAPNLSKSLNLRSSLNPPPSLQPQHPLLPSPKTHLITTPPHPSTLHLNNKTSATTIYQTPTHPSTPHSPLPTPHSPTPSPSPPHPRLTAFPKNTQAHKCYQRLLETIYLGTHITSLNQLPYLPPLLLTCSLLPFLSSNSRIPYDEVRVLKGLGLETMKGMRGGFRRVNGRRGGPGGGRGLGAAMLILRTLNTVTLIR